MHLRCNDPRFLQKVSNYYRRLFEEVRPYLAENGGNIIAVQVENEYGSYGNDKDYLRAVAKIYEENGVHELFFTSDGPNDLMLGGAVFRNIWQLQTLAPMENSTLISFASFIPTVR